MGNCRVTSPASGALLDLPLGVPLADWPAEWFAHVPCGNADHVVRFVELDGETLVLKEAPDPVVEREDRMLRSLAERSVPCVEAYGTIVERRAERGDEPLGGLLVTRQLTPAQPYRSVFGGRPPVELRTRLVNAMAGLLVRLHRVGAYWGDCSLSNTLLRREAGTLAAYLVDAETGELHDRLTDEQRARDLEIAAGNIARELTELRSAEVVTSLRRQYASLWTELADDTAVRPGESYRIDARLRRLHRLGFDVRELTITTGPDGPALHLDPRVVEAGYHQRRLVDLIGLRVPESRARTLLGELWRFKAKWEHGLERPVSDDLAVQRWLDEKFFGTLGLVPSDLRRKRPDAELFHEITEHRWMLSEAQGRDVGRASAVASYVTTVLADLTDVDLDPSSGPPTEEFEPFFDW